MIPAVPRCALFDFVCSVLLYRTDGWIIKLVFVVCLQERRAKRAESDGDDDDDYDDDTEFSPGSGLSRSKSINRQRLVAHSTGKQMKLVPLPIQCPT